MISTSSTNVFAAEDRIESIITLDEALDRASMSSLMYNNEWNALWAQDINLSRLKGIRLSNVWFEMLAESYMCHAVYLTVPENHSTNNLPSMWMILSSEKYSDAVLLCRFILSEDKVFILECHSILSKKISDAKHSQFENIKVIKTSISDPSFFDRFPYINP